MNPILAAAIAELTRLGNAPLAALVQQFAGSAGPGAPSQWTNGMSQPDNLGRVRLQAMFESPDVPPEDRDTLFFVREAITTFPLNDFQRFQVLHNCGGTFAVPNTIHGFNPESGTRMASEYVEDVHYNWLGQERRTVTMVRVLGDTLAFEATVPLAQATDKALAHWRRQNALSKG
jgi:hypothetical protein